MVNSCFFLPRPLENNAGLKSIVGWALRLEVGTLQQQLVVKANETVQGRIIQNLPMHGVHADGTNAHYRCGAKLVEQLEGGEDQPNGEERSISVAPSHQTWMGLTDWHPRLSDQNRPIQSESFGLGESSERAVARRTGRSVMLSIFNRSVFSRHLQTRKPHDRSIYVQQCDGQQSGKCVEETTSNSSFAWRATSSCFHHLAPGCYVWEYRCYPDAYECTACKPTPHF